jgi:hypothetical protein
LSDEDRAALDNADPEDVRRALINVFRQGDGAELRASLKVLRADDHPVARGLYEKLVYDPARCVIWCHTESCLLPMLCND